MAEVLSLPMRPEGSSYFSSSPMQHSSPTSFLINSPPSSGSYSRSSSKSPHLYTEYAQQPTDHSPVASTPDSPSRGGHVPAPSPRVSSPPDTPLSAEAKFDDEDQILFPSYDDFTEHIEDLEPPPSPKSGNSYEVSPGSNSVNTTENASRLGSPERKKSAEDDTAARPEPVEHVDYLSHNWKEDELWASWRHIVSKRKVYSNSERLENASWRTWTMSKNRLRTVRPETLNWQKESDVTWLYGPLQTSSSMSFLPSSAPPERSLSKSNSFLNKKPILKKRSMSEMMLQRSRSASSLLKQATASVQAQQKTEDDKFERPRITRASSDFVGSSRGSTFGSEKDASTQSSADSSCPQTPGASERKHIHFNDCVEQCIAVDGKDGDDEDEPAQDNYGIDDDSSDDEGLIMMKGSSKSRQSSGRSTPRASFSSESKTIAMLPSTTLNYREDDPNSRQQPKSPGLGGLWGSTCLSPSPSQETLRPSRAYGNFLLVDDDEDADMGWEPPHVDKNGDIVTGSSTSGDEMDGLGPEASGGMRRTPSGMFMPYEEDEDDIVAAGLFGKVVNAVNTAKDIGHVIWNVGWKA
ncbi:MAG: hypothetical protein M4579_002537 [Chaenotheca gracillima]|nr:MAG: hypothetical protein M4579_002537 [Chaenotheca gracillima]